MDLGRFFGGPCIRFPCDECHYNATLLSDLRKHKEYKHEGIKNPCDHCDYAATQLSSLRTHTEFIHDGIIHSCDQCEFFVLQE